MSSVNTADVQTLWSQYKAGGDPQARIKLIEHYARLAKTAAERVHVPVNAMFSQEDIYGHAIIGLIDAIEKYDPDKGRPFEVYAPLRIKGAIADALRSTDWMPRSVRHNETRLKEVMARIEMREGRGATDAEICRELDMTEDQLFELYQATNASAVQSLEELILEIGDLNSTASFADNNTGNPEQLAENSQVRRLLQEAIDNLPDNEKTVVALYYFEDMTLKEIGRVLGVTESRACQLHTKAILKLQTSLSCWMDVMFMAA